MKTSEFYFISHSTSDSAFASKLYNDLSANGANLWMDQVNLKPGDLWVEKAIGALKSAAAIIVILSPESVKESTVLDEISFARDNKIRIVPVMKVHCKLPIQLSNIQYIDMTVDYNNGLNELLADLGLREPVPMALRLINLNKTTRSTRLDLSNCGMTEIPPEIAELVWLEELVIAGREYYDLDTNLTVLVVSKNNGANNSFSQFPAGMDKLVNLKKLVLCGNEQLGPNTSFSFIENYRALRYLDISATSAADLLPLTNLQELTHLKINNTLVKDLQPLSGLQSLYRLYMPDIFISDISPLSGLKSLAILNMKGNRVSDLTALAGLTNLEELEIQSCGLSNIQPLSGLVKLRYLDLSSNPVSDISPLAKLHKLSSLLCTYTEVNSFTAIAGLKKLHRLIFNNCMVTSLAPLASMKVLTAFECRENPVNDCPADVYEAGDPKQLRAYFKAKTVEAASRTTATDNGAEPANNDSANDLRRDVKLIVLGNSNVGKTNLVNFLETGQFFGTRKTTHGLEVHRWIPDKDRFPALNDIAVSIWDFGGQEYYHEAYRLFLSANAVYLLLWCKETDRNRPESTRLNDQEPPVMLEHFEISYWLDTIRYYTGSNLSTTAGSTAANMPVTEQKPASNTRIIAVQNKVDDIELDKKRIAQELHEQYKISDSFHISLLKGSDTGNTLQNKRLGYFLSELESAIVNNADTEKPPANWQRVRKAILDLKSDNDPGNPFRKNLTDDHWISLKDFREACKVLAAGLTEDELYTLPRWLDKGGVVVYFPGIAALQDKIFLRPDQLAADIYRILSDDIRLLGGEFAADDLFGKKEKDKQEIFLELTKQLDLVFPHPVKKSAGKYLAPQYLPENHPIEDLFKIASQGAWQSQLWIKVPLFYYKKILNGLLLHFASEEFTECRYFWKHGIMFVNEGLRVLIKGLYPDTIHHEGIILLGVEQDKAKRDMLVKKIFDEVLRLVSAKPGVSNSSSPASSLQTPAVDIKVSYDGVNYISYQSLLESANEPKLRASNSNTWLITHHFAAIMPSPPQKAKRVFLSYSHQNTKWLVRLRSHLAGIRRAKMIEAWDDKEILPGDHWDTLIRTNLEEADVFILLLSADFIASEYIWNEELRAAFRKLKERNAVLIPILFEPLDLGGLPEITDPEAGYSYKISDFEIIPKNTGGQLQAVSLWPNQEEALALVAESIRMAILKK